MITKRPYPIVTIINHDYYEKQKDSWTGIELKSITLGIYDYNQLKEENGLNFYFKPGMDRVEEFCMGVPIKISYKRKRLIRLNWKLTDKQKKFKKMLKHMKTGFETQFMTTFEGIDPLLYSTFTNKKS